jgi:hypothetical protein
LASVAGSGNRHFRPGNFKRISVTVSKGWYKADWGVRGCAVPYATHTTGKIFPTSEISGIPSNPIFGCKTPGKRGVSEGKPSGVKVAYRVDELSRQTRLLPGRKTLRIDVCEKASVGGKTAVPFSQ